MNAAREWSRRLAAVAMMAAALTAPALADNASDDAPSPGTSLKWTPHRPTRMADASAAAAAEPKQAPPAATIPAPAPSPTAAPDAVSNPRITLEDVEKTRIRPAQPPGDWSSANRLPGRFKTSAGIQDPPGLFPSIFARSPQGEASRPMLASGEYQPPRVYGSRGLLLPEAPRFNGLRMPGQKIPQGQGQPGPNGRVAMNADDIPSVMTRQKEVGVETVPTPAASAPAAAGPVPASKPLASPSPQGPFIEAMPDGSGTLDFGPGVEGMPMETMPAEGGMLMGGYPDAVCCDPYSHDMCCEDEACELIPGCGCCCSGRVCGWLRQFGRPYYGWRWYRDFSASAGITGFENPADLGLAGNFGTNEYANWAMPFWNAFGIGWQLGVRGVQTNFQSVTINGLTDDPFITRARNQFFLTTGFFTRAFEGRGLQFGAVWDYLRDNWYDDVDLAQIRGEISYVWHVHEFGFWGAANYDTTPFTSRRFNGNASTLDLYTAFYRLHFGDANEWKVWGGASENGDGLVGTLLRAPMTRSLALEGTFTYLVPKGTTTVNLGDKDTSITASNSAWNLSVNVVFYPACRARRGLASPYRPLFEVADNGSMIRSLEGLIPKKP